MIENKAKEVLDSISKELEQLRSIAIDEILNNLFKKKKKALEYYKRNKNKYEVISMVYGNDGADAVIMEEIYDLLDDYYCGMPLEERTTKNISWIGRFKLPELPSIIFSGKKRRELIREFGYDDAKIYEPYRDEKDFGQVLDSLLKTKYLGIFYQGANYFSHNFLEEEAFYEVVIQVTDRGYVIDSIIVRRKDDFFFEEDILND